MLNVNRHLWSRSVGRLAVLAGLMAFCASSSRADEYPNHPVTLIVPSPAGGGTEFRLRLPLPGTWEERGKRKEDHE